MTVYLLLIVMSGEKPALYDVFSTGHPTAKACEVEKANVGKPRPNIKLACVEVRIP